MLVCYCLRENLGVVKRICLQKMTMEDVALRNQDILRFMRYTYIYMHLCLWLSQPSQSNVAGSKRNKIVLIIAEYLHISRHLFFFLKEKGFLKEE